MKITYCPICNKTTFYNDDILDVYTHCPKCGHHLNYMEEKEKENKTGKDYGINN